MIAELLNEGAENAKTGRDLAQILGCDIRTVTEQIERERRAGKPICAASRGPKAGYYLAATQEDLQAYCDIVKGRAIELFKTRQALISVLKQLPVANQE